MTRSVGGTRDAAPADQRRDIEVIPATDMDELRTLFREYQAFLDVDLCFQDFEAELEGLPGKYAPPRGAALLARVDARTAGCVAVRPIEGSVCEMKRLFVRPGFRGLGLGRLLAEAIVDAAQKAGYRSMRLDTLDRLDAALELYRSMGFYAIAPYYGNPLDGVVYLEKKLA